MFIIIAIKEKSPTWSGPSGLAGLSVTSTLMVTVSLPLELVAVTVYSPVSSRRTGRTTSLVKYSGESMVTAFDGRSGMFWYLIDGDGK